MSMKRIIYTIMVLSLVSISVIGCTPQTTAIETEAPQTEVATESPVVAPTEVSQTEESPTALPEVTEAPTEQPKYGGVLRYSGLRDPGGLDPHKSYGLSSSYLQGNVYDTLVEYDDKGEIVGALAESWEQPDSQTLIFKLRQGVVFQDGTEFNADDVIATINRMKNPDTGAALKALIGVVEEITADDPLTVTMKLSVPDVTLLNTLANQWCYIVSDQDVANGFDFVTATNGTGAFILTSYEPNMQYVLDKNPNYWKAGLPYLDQVVITPIPDTAARMNSIRSGDAELVEYVTWQEIENLKDFVIYKEYGTYNYLRLNVSVPPLDKKEFRQALNYIVDRDAMSQLAWGGLAYPITGALQMKGDPWYQEELEGYYYTDHEKAMELIKQAGYETLDQVPPLEIGTTVNPVLMDTGQVALQQLIDFGLKVEWKTFDSPTLVSNRSEGTYVIQQDGASWLKPDPDSYRSIFHSKTGNTYAVAVGYKNERLDEVLDEASQILDFDQRKALYLEAEKIILDDAPYVFELYRVQATATVPYLHGYVELPPNLSNYKVNRFEYFWLDQ